MKPALNQVSKVSIASFSLEIAHIRSNKREKIHKASVRTASCKVAFCLNSNLLQNVVCALLIHQILHCFVLTISCLRLSRFLNFTLSLVYRWFHFIARLSLGPSYCSLIVISNLLFVYHWFHHFAHFFICMLSSKTRMFFDT